MAIYDRLLDHHGAQNWWPADSDFEMITGAILTQNTAWSNVKKALHNLRAADVWSFPATLSLQQDDLAALIRPSGYYNQKAKKLQILARFLEERFGGDTRRLFQLEMPELREALLGLWGIGPETADDIILYAARMPSFVIDTYTIRLIERLHWRAAGNKYTDYQHLFTSQLPLDADLFGEFHALIDRHCNSTCRKTPLCGECCLKEICPTGLINLRHKAG